MVIPEYYLFLLISCSKSILNVNVLLYHKLVTRKQVLVYNKNTYLELYIYIYLYNK